jgi:hypothetical protein
MVNQITEFYLALHCLIHLNLFYYFFFFPDMAPLYEILVSQLVLELDDRCLNSMRTNNQNELKKLNEKWVLCFFFSFNFNLNWASVWLLRILDIELGLSGLHTWWVVCELWPWFLMGHCDRL